MSKVFITGTDTDVGKTFAACALLHAAQHAGKRTCAMKPVASGCTPTDEGLRNNDALLLTHFATEKLPYAQVNPFAFQQAIAPHVAAKLANKTIEPPDLIYKAQAFLQTPADFHLIEGAGGWRVPISEQGEHHYYFSDFALELNLPVILVVAIRLGCINHALLSAEAIERSGLKLLGWLANLVEAADDFVVRENIASIEKGIAAPLLATFPQYKNLETNVAIAQAAKQFSDTSLRHIFSS